MKILILGGTGAMGAALVRLLSMTEHSVHITSRQERHSNYANISYIQGNALNDDFIKQLLHNKYDVIIDFMCYDTAVFKQRKQLFLDNTSQYFFFSSARVYADAGKAITEDSSRLLDVSEDSEYLKTDEYALKKAREENILLTCGEKNWTIIRPYITYNTNRIQLGVLEKENWLYRALQGKTIVVTQDILNKETTLTYANDVARVLVKLIGNEHAMGDVFQIVSRQKVKWGDILNLYLSVFEKVKGYRPKVLILENSLEMQPIWGRYQIKYDRLFDRYFDSEKVDRVCGVQSYVDTFEGLETCLTDFLQSPSFRWINWRYEAWCDKICGEHAKLSEIPGKKMKVKYILWRYFGLVAYF